MSGNSLAFDKEVPAVAKYAPFVAAGFLFAPATFLHEVPFDPFLPYIFMGEEISMSARLWTSGYDIFSPTVNVLNHYYVRRHYPKFWESVNRLGCVHQADKSGFHPAYIHTYFCDGDCVYVCRSFRKPIHNDIVEVIIKRVKNMLGYPEALADFIHPNNVLYRWHIRYFLCMYARLLDILICRTGP